MSFVYVHDDHSGFRIDIVSMPFGLLCGRFWYITSQTKVLNFHNLVYGGGKIGVLSRKMGGNGAKSRYHIASKYFI